MFAKYQGESLNKVIYKKVLRINIENIRPADPLSTFKRVDHEAMIIDQSGINYLELIIWSLGILFFTFIPLLPNYKRHGTVDDIFLPIFIIFFLILLINSLRDCRKIYIFNRKEGTVTYPTYWLGSETVPFSEAIIIRGKKGLRSAIPIGLAFVSKNRRNQSYIHYDYTYAMLSLYVWYMDRNRPLPPGTAFDRYREADYIRRKDEGFPEPLYMSAIQTPKWEGAEARYRDKEAQKRQFVKYDPSLGATARETEPEIPEEDELRY